MTGEPHTSVDRSERSALVEQRRAAMLVELQAAMRRRTAVRRGVRGVGAAAALMLLAVGVWSVVGGRNPSPASSSDSSASAVTPAPHATENVAPTTVARVDRKRSFLTVFGTSDIKVSSHIVSGASPLGIEYLDDDALMAALAQTGESYGMIRAGNRTMITCNTCERPLDGSESEEPSGMNPRIP